MKSKYLVLPGLVAVLFAFTATVSAVPITGTVTIQGGTTLVPQGSALGSVSGVGLDNLGSILTGSGSFAGTAGAANVSFTGFNIQNGAVSISPLWSFTIGAVAYSFDLAQMTVTTKSDASLVISGTGFLHITGFDTTPGTWSYQINSTTPDGKQNGVGGIFSYQSSNTAIPDGGMTVVLLGAALSGLYVFRRKSLS